MAKPYRSSVKVGREYLKQPFFVLHGPSIGGVANEKAALRILSPQSDLRALYQYRLDIKQRLRQALTLKPDQEDGQRLRNRYEDIQENLFLFLEDATIPPTNNSSEQAIRMSTVFRKVTHGFRSAWGKDLFAAVRSVVNNGIGESQIKLYG